MTLADANTATPSSVIDKCRKGKQLSVHKKTKTSVKAGFCRISVRRSAPLSGTTSKGTTNVLAGIESYKLSRDFGQEAETEETFDSPNETAEQQQQVNNRVSSVRFSPRVEIVDIPHHSVYPKCIKRALWNSGKHIRKAALRSALEFAFEGRDWRSALEEDSFVTRPNSLAEAEDEDQNSEEISSNLIHPAHIFGVCE